MSDFMIQVLGFAAMGLIVLSFQVHSNRWMLVMQIAGNLFFGAQYLLLGSLSGCLALVITILRNLLFLKQKDWAWVRSRGCLAAFVVLYVAAAALTMERWVDVLPCIAMIGATVGIFTYNAQKIRLSQLVCCCPCLLLFDILVGSWGGVLNESSVLISILISIFRYGWKNMGRHDSGFED